MRAPFEIARCACLDDALISASASGGTVAGGCVRRATSVATASAFDGSSASARPTSRNALFLAVAS